MKRAPLPLFGPGPYLVGGGALITALALALVNVGWLTSGDLPALKTLALALGALLVAGGVALWAWAALGCRISAQIKAGRLVTTGAYGLTRNPIYAAFWLAFSGMLIGAHNLWLLPLPLVLYLALTAALKATEERWLAEQFSDAYRTYCRRVNRIIPWPSRPGK